MLLAKVPMGVPTSYLIQVYQKLKNKTKTEHFIDFQWYVDSDLKIPIEGSNNFNVK